MWGRDFNMNGAFERRTRVKEFENLLIQLEKVYGRALPHISRLQEFSTHTHVLLFQQRKESELQNEGIEKEIDAIQKVGVDECAGACIDRSRVLRMGAYQSNRSVHTSVIFKASC